MIGTKKHWVCGYWLGMAALLAASTRGTFADDRPMIDVRDRQAMSALLADLGSGDFAVRERAQKRVDAIPASQKADLQKLAEETADPEAHARLLGRVAMLEELAATDPPPISLEVRNANLKIIAAELSKALGVPITGENGVDHFTLSAKGLPLWEVIKQLSAQHPVTLNGSGMSPMLSSASSWRDSVRYRGFTVGIGDLRWQQAGVQANALILLNGNVVQVINIGNNNGIVNVAVRGNVAVPGAFVVQGNGNLILQGAAVPGAGPSGPTLNGVLSIAADPRVHLLGVAGSELVQAEDEGGHRLIPPGGDSGRNGTSIVRGTMWSRSFTLDAPEHGGKIVKTMRGQVVVTVALSEKTIEVKDPEKHEGEVLYRGGREVSLQQFMVMRDNALAGAATVRLQLRVKETAEPGFGGFPAAPGGPSLTAVRAMLVDAKGTQLSLLYASNGVTGTTIRTNVVEPVKLVIMVPEKTRDVVVPFEFKNVPIPGQ